MSETETTQGAAPETAAEPTEKEIMKAARRTSIGGQALLEGIMMRGPKLTAMAVRDPDGKMVIEKWETKGADRGKFFKLPFIRGIFNMYDSLTFGYKCLMRSAEISGLEDTKPEETAPTPDDQTSEAEVPEKNSDGTPMTADKQKQEKSKGRKPKSAEKEKAENTAVMVTGVLLGVVLAVALFLFLPVKITEWLSAPLPVLGTSVFLKSLTEGVIRIILFVGYMASMLFVKDIKRTYMYHGAEHKTIFCYEHGLPLTVENVRLQKKYHPRCGTSFMILVLLVGIIISMLIPAGIQTLLRVAIKLICIPLVVGIGYELIKLAGRHDNILTAVISAPGKLLQRITVFEPTDDMIECAIAAFKEVVPQDGSDKW